RIDQAERAATVLGAGFYESMPFAGKSQPEATSVTELILRRTWKPALSVIGLDGMPAITNAGNVTLPKLSVKLSMRLPPSCDAESAASKMKSVLESDPPNDVRVHFEVDEVGSGWNAPRESAWLLSAAD